MKGIGWKLSSAFRKVMGLSSSISHGSASMHHSDDYTPSPIREEEVPQEEQFEPQAMEVEELQPNLHGNREAQAYALIKDRVSIHTRAFDFELLENTSMDVDFANIWHIIGWNDFVPISEEGSRLLTIQFLCTLQKDDDGFAMWQQEVDTQFNAINTSLQQSHSNIQTYFRS
ncbi:hypothetical protein SETIT_9G267600v2 [Setaria italica]|uniref:Uncharacterized protein n=1 Tax=Setaria italica TaxID=4555 RepID=A0A368SL45_SETIT|nr:hypothetical protein SETIT_9G267600v2 [Setaria italica]